MDTIFSDDLKYGFDHGPELIFPDDFWQEMDQPDGRPQGRLPSRHADPKATPAARRVKPASRQANAVNIKRGVTIAFR
jgi:hypothetical protein